MPERDAIDDEAIASLVDGKLSRRRRKALLARLVVTDDEHDAFVATSAIVSEMEQEDQAPAGGSLRTSTRLDRWGQLLRRLSAAIRFRR